MINGRKNNLKDGSPPILSVWLLILLLTSVTWANYSPHPHFYNPLTPQRQDAIQRDTFPVRGSWTRIGGIGTDSVPSKDNPLRKPDPTAPRPTANVFRDRDSLTNRNDTLPGRDSLVNKTDSFNVKMSGDSLDAPV